ncbi:type VI secretion system Vgr family protein [Marivita sp. S0852]|uniref:type VI secretion system Vgr family protein n=1 Tax=Marivita sp. S0852 TaxID=3373893 RepID=UPI003982C102
MAGPEGQEIHPDEYGRIKLWVPWDRRAAKDGTDTCWGGQVISRIGMEVMVTYLDGDPDRPVVTGVVPNERQRVPYELPANKTRSTFRTNTHKSDYHGFNELSFEDEKDEERIYLHAERDNEIHVQNNRAKRVDVSEVESIGNSKFSEVGKDCNFQIGGNAVTAIGVADVQINTPKPMKPFDDGPLRLAYSATVAGQPDPTRGHYKLLVAQSRTEEIGTQSTTRIGDSATTSIGTGYTLDIGAKQLVSVGASSYESVAKGRYMHVGTEIDLRCGAARFIMRANGEIELIGTKIKVNGTTISMNAGRIDLN